jgi:hypothetical protein
MNGFMFRHVYYFDFFVLLMSYSSVMKFAALLFFAFSFSFVVFAKKHKHRYSPPPALDIVSITMNRTQCHGSCPVYQIVIDNKGIVTFTGIRYTADSGAFRKNIGTKAFNIFRLFYSYRVDTCGSYIFKHPADLPGLNFSIHFRDSTKFIRHADLGPAWLSALADSIDAIGLKRDNAGWLKVNSSK